MATEPLVYLSRFSPGTESATLSAMRGWRRDEAEEILREEGGTPYVLLADYDALRARVAELEADADRREDRAYVSGARQAQAMAHQSLQALDQWINAGCGGRFGVGLSGNKGAQRNGD